MNDELHPFTSRARLCFSGGPQNWEPGVSHAPAFVSLGPAGHYNVWSGDPYTSSPALVLETDDAKHAAAELECLLWRAGMADLHGRLPGSRGTA